MKNILKISILLVLPLLSNGAAASDLEVGTRPLCGFNQKGISARIKDCSRFRGSTVTSSSGVKWKLVTRKGQTAKSGDHDYYQPCKVEDGGKYECEKRKFFEVWLNTKTNQVWSEKLLYRQSWDLAVSICETGMLEDHKSPDYLNSTAGLGKGFRPIPPEVQFSAPSYINFRDSFNDGLSEVVSNWEHGGYWTGTPVRFEETHLAYFVSTREGSIEVGQRYMQDSIPMLCVGKIMVP